MLEDQLAVGTIIKFPLTVRMNASVTSRERREISVDCGALALTLASGQANPAFRVQYVPYADTEINCVESNEEVISGIFTGCIMTAYKFEERRRVAHISTSTDPQTDCKEAMRELLLRGYKEIASFRPYSNGEDFDIFNKIAQTHPYGPEGVATFGLITEANVCISIVTSRVINAKNQFRVEDFKEKAGNYVY